LNFIAIDGRLSYFTVMSTLRNQCHFCLAPTITVINKIPLEDAVRPSSGRRRLDVRPASRGAFRARVVHESRALKQRAQGMLARHLNVAVKLIGEWARGEKHPSGPERTGVRVTDRPYCYPGTLVYRKVQTAISAAMSSPRRRRSSALG
jgi:hypothetical protein